MKEGTNSVQEQVRDQRGGKLRGITEAAVKGVVVCVCE